MDFSFSGAGFMGCYYFGVVDCLNKYIPRDRLGRVAGASAGSLIAAYYLLELPLKDCLKEIIAMTEDIRRRPLGVFDRSNQMVDVLPRVLDKLFPEDAHKRLSGRLHVCLTCVKDMKKVVVSQFDSKRDLIDALNCSCFIPLWSGNHVSTYKGAKYIDGGFSDNLPVFDAHTIRVCCFAGASDISPLDGFQVDAPGNFVFLNTPLYLNWANLRRARRALTPPPAAYILDLLEQGFHDTKDFILSNDLIQCQACYHNNRAHSQLLAPGGPTLRASPALARRPGRSLPTAASLERHLHAKLAADVNNNNNNNHTVPSILLNHLPAAAAEQLNEEQQLNEDQLNEEQQNKERDEEEERKWAQSQALSQRFLRRRSTLADAAAGLPPAHSLAAPLADKFSLAPHPLPSCPPSPSLDRHCAQCLRLREEARRDLLEEGVRESAASFVDTHVLLKKNRFKAPGLGSPMRWLRHWRTRTSYDLAARDQQLATAAARHEQPSAT